MTENRLEISKTHLAQAFRRLEQLIEQKLQHNQVQSKAAIAETHRLEKHLKTISSTMILLRRNQSSILRKYALQKF